MDLALLAAYNFAAVGIAVAGMLVERRRPRLGVALLLLALALILNLFVGGALLFVPFILALYGTLLGLPAVGMWLLVRRLRRGRRAAEESPAP